MPILNCIRAVVLSTLFCAWTVSAATLVSPNLTGTWTGTAKGNDYHEHNDPMDTTPAVEKVSGTFNCTFAHVGDDLTVNAQVQGGSESFSMTLTGKAGDFALWATGTNLTSDGITDSVFMSGHFAPKGDKLIGNFIFSHSGNITYISYTFKKSAGAALTRSAIVPDTASAASRDNTDPPFNITGKATGKFYNFGTNAKAGSYKAIMSGMITPIDHTATLNFADGVGLSFSTTENNADKFLTLSGTGGSESIVLFGKSGNTSATGTGWIYGATRVVEFKFSIKKQ